MFVALCVHAGEPPLPLGLGKQSGQATTGNEPTAEPEWVLTGFADTRVGVRTQADRHQDAETLAETRLQLALERQGQQVGIRLSADLLFDALADRRTVDLETGEGYLDLREAYLLLRPASFADLKVGRQILTWGTGDLLFINDLFPKDYPSFFIGRDAQYLKAPSDAIRMTLFSSAANLDLVYTPRFDADRFVDGRRVSFFNRQLGRLSGERDVVRTLKPNDWFGDDEIALRLYRNLGGYEFALYGYRGFWKSPAGVDTLSGRATFPRLGVYGASLRGPAAGGIAHLEFGYYDSLDDRDGDDPAVRNSEIRLLAGYERELKRELTLGTQYYLERRLAHEDYKQALPADSPAEHRDRHVLTLRLTQRLMKQDLELSMFAFYSPSDDDGYVRPLLRYRIDDNWAVDVGGNWFFGQDEHTLFGQLENNSNVYLGVRYGFSD